MLFPDPWSNRSCRRGLLTWSESGTASASRCLGAAQIEEEDGFLEGGPHRSPLPLPPLLADRPRPEMMPDWSHPEERGVEALSPKPSKMLCLLSLPSPALPAAACESMLQPSTVMVTAQ